MRDKRLYILDAYGLIYRSYYAFMNTSMYSPKGVNTSTVFGFLLALEDILKKQQPTHIVAAFDLGHETFRHQAYSEYKANRMVTPEEIKISVPIIRQALDILQIPVIEDTRYEADDIAGTLAFAAQSHGFDVYLVTSDKDYFQLVDEHIFIYRPGKSGGSPEIFGVSDVCQKFEVDAPNKIIDILALWGDSSDNVPGMPGIGEKTAKKLIAEFGSIDNLLLNLDKLSPKQKQNFIENAEKLKLSKFLVTIDTQVPCVFDESKFLLKKPDELALTAFFNELNFKTLISRFVKKDAPKIPEFQQGTLFAPPVSQPGLFDAVQQSTYKTVADIPHEYNVLSTVDDINFLIELIKNKKEFCFDTETGGLDPYLDVMVGISFCIESHKSFYLPVDENNAESVKDLLRFKDVFEDDSIDKIGHNLKFDILFLYRFNIKVNGKLFDTMLAHYLLQPEQNHKMDNLARKYLNYSPIPIENLIGRKGISQSTMQNVPLNLISEYACEDSDVTWQLKEILNSQLDKKGLTNLYNNLEGELLKVLIEVEINGFRVDASYLNSYSVVLLEDIKKIEDEIYIHAGQRINIASPKQLGDILFEKLKIPYDGKLTKTKQYSTNEETLQLLTDKHEIVPLILDYRGLTKLQSTYVDALPKIINQKTGKIHTSFNQSLAVTGRLSSSNPNLQNIPIRDERGRDIRKAFVASEGCVILSADYSQIELRLMAHMSQDENMIEAFKQNADIHTITASKVFHVPEDEVSKDQRRKAKTANFGIIYGISAFGLSQRMNIPRKEASELIQEYFKTFPGVKKYMSDIILYAKEHGYVQTLMNRRRYLPDINSQNAIVRGMAERNAINTPIQGTAADIIKLAMINIHKEFITQKLQSKMILQVHDELVFDVFVNEVEIVQKIVKDKMEQAVVLTVPLLVETGVGSNWLEAH